MWTIEALTVAWIWGLAGSSLTVGIGAFVLIVGGLAAVFLSMVWSALRRPSAALPVERRRTPWRRMQGMLVGGLCGGIVYWMGTIITLVDAMVRMPDAMITVPFISSWAAGLVLLGAFIGGAVSDYRWHGAGLMGYVGLVSMIVGYVLYAVTVTIPEVPQHERWVSYALLGAEGGGLLLITVFSFYSFDATTRRRWRRRPEDVPYDPDMQPKVALEVPVFNEPTEMIEETVRRLVAQDYPRERFCVVVADDSTDEAAQERNREMCRRLGAYHVVRKVRSGYKAGALNHVNRQLQPDIELVAIVDADYWVDPDYLRTLVGYFADERLGFLQTPQDYRNLDESFLTRRYQQAEAYFYHGIMPSRNEENTIIFCGTMGIIRKKALDEVGGFAEDQICEDAEVSVRLAAAGWRSLYIDQSFGKGLMPAVFESYKKQYHRWAFGNVGIMFSRTGLILRSRMTIRQKVDYMLSSLHWFDGFFVAAIGFILLYLGLGPILGYDVVSHHQREVALLALVPMVLIIDGLYRLRYVLRATRTRTGRRIGLREALLVQGLWFAIKMTNVRAVTKAMLGFKTPFVRTPKHPGRRLGRASALQRSVRMTKMESVMGVTLVGVAGVNFQPSVWQQNGDLGFLLPTWLGLYALFFLAAPIYAYLSYRTLAPAAVALPDARSTPEPVAMVRSVRRGAATAKGYGKAARVVRIAPVEARARRTLTAKSLVRRRGVPARR